MTDRIPMTRQGYDKKRQEVERLEHEEMPAILERLEKARSEGDLSENAEYHGARESQGMLQAKIDQLKGQLARAEIVDPSKLPRDKVVFGSTIKVKDLDLDDIEEFTLVGAGEDDPENGKILYTSPLAQGFVDHKVGDKIEVEVPAGTLSFEILEIRFEE